LYFDDDKTTLGGMRKKVDRSPGRKRARTPPGVRQMVRDAIAHARDLRLTGREQKELLAAKRSLEEAMRHLFAAEATRARRQVRPSRPMSFRLPKVEDALSDFFPVSAEAPPSHESPSLPSVAPADDASRSAPAHGAPPDGPFFLVRRLCVLAEGLLVREVKNGALEGASLPFETVRSIVTRLLVDAGIQPTIVAQALGTRRGSNKHDNALHKVVRDLTGYKKGLAQVARNVKEQPQRIAELLKDDAEHRPAASAPEDEQIGSSVEIARRRWFEVQAGPSTDA
jgi:hypothetical protein